MFKSSSLYKLLITDTIELTFISKIIINVINKGKVITLSQKDKVININTFSIDLKMINAWCSNFFIEVVNSVITSDNSDV